MIASTNNQRTIESIQLDSVQATHEYGKTLCNRITLPAVCYFNGQLGAGKTTLIQGILKAYGCDHSITSPTYNLIHEYDLGNIVVYHLDLYRLQDPEELEVLGIRDLLHDTSLLLIEWPEMGQGYLPVADYIINLKTENTMRNISLEKVT